jgi:hypothetical protein
MVAFRLVHCPSAYPRELVAVVVEEAGAERAEIQILDSLLSHHMQIAHQIRPSRKAAVKTLLGRVKPKPRQNLVKTYKTET